MPRLLKTSSIRSVSMQIRSKVTAESRTAAQQHYNMRAMAAIHFSENEFNLLVPGFSSCCDGCSSCSSGW
jgi:hypothetical protein